MSGGGAKVARALVPVASLKCVQEGNHSCSSKKKVRLLVLCTGLTLLSLG